MPSTVISSSAFASSGIALNSQSFTEDISGLVRASLTFTTTASRADEMSQLFYVDAPPPVWPDSIDRFVLQSQQLYMVNRTVDKFAGLVTIKAQYAGALSNAIANPRVSLERKSVSFNMSPAVAREVYGTTWQYTAAPGLGWYLRPETTYVSINGGPQRPQQQLVYDLYIGNATIGVKRVSFASVGEDTFSITPPSISSLILGATTTSKVVSDLSVRFNPRPSGGDYPFAAGSGKTVGEPGPSGGIIEGPFFDQSRSTVSLLGEFGGYRIATDTGIDFITPTVFVRTARFWLEQ
jgi:hypothetical protein